MDEKIFSELEEKIVKSLGKKDEAVYNEYQKNVKNYIFIDTDLFVSLSKVLMLIYGDPVSVTRPSGRVDMNAPVIDGMYPLHLAVLTSSQLLVRRLIGLDGARLDVKCCGDPNSPFYGLTPLEMALQVLRRNLIPWTPQVSVHELLSMFHGNAKVKSLMENISLLAYITPRIRHLVTEYSLQGKVVELAALLKLGSSHPIDYTIMYVPSADIPPELHFGVPMMLRLLVATRSASLIKECIQLSAGSNPEEYENCKIKLKEMDFIGALLESARRGDLNRFDKEQQSTVNIELTDDMLVGSQDESKVNTVAPWYLKNSLFYMDSSKFQAPGIFNTMMPRGYEDKMEYYDGFDIRSCNALAETIFRVLDGKKVEELTLRDASDFRDELEDFLKNKFKEAVVLTVHRSFPLTNTQIQW
nr:PREDICTED: uncharacterized protein LOC108196351 isoform X2 [Daucus carota subsp. sativus]